MPLFGAKATLNPGSIVTVDPFLNHPTERQLNHAIRFVRDVHGLCGARTQVVISIMYVCAMKVPYHNRSHNNDGRFKITGRQHHVTCYLSANEALYVQVISKVWRQRG